jgi:hypothetical protein
MESEAKYMKAPISSLTPLKPFNEKFSGEEDVLWRKENGS